MEQQHPPPLSHGKIFVGGLSRETTTSGLREYFERFGDISDCVVMKDRATGLPRGFGFVTYASQIIADRVVLHRHIIDGKEVEAKPAVPRDSEALMSRGTATVSGAANGLPHACAPQAGGDFGTKKIFVGGLAHETSEADFTSYFGESHLSTTRLLKPRRPHVLAHPQLPPPPPPALLPRFCRYFRECGRLRDNVRPAHAQAARLRLHHVRGCRRRRTRLHEQVSRAQRCCSLLKRSP